MWTLISHPMWSSEMRSIAVDQVTCKALNSVSVQKSGLFLYGSIKNWRGNKIIRCGIINTNIPHTNMQMSRGNKVWICCCLSLTQLWFAACYAVRRLVSHLIKHHVATVMDIIVPRNHLHHKWSFVTFPLLFNRCLHSDDQPSARTTQANNKKTHNKNRNIENGNSVQLYNKYI